MRELPPGAGAPGHGPLFGPGSPYLPAALAPRIRARENSRLAVALTAIAQRDLERGWGNPPLGDAFAAIDPADRGRLLMLPDLRRWIARLIRATHPHSEPDAALPVQVQAVWNQLAVPWLKTPASARGNLWLLIFGDGRVPFPGTGLRLAQVPTGRRIRVFLKGDFLYFHAENGVMFGEVSRPALLAAAQGTAPPPPGFAGNPRLAGSDIEITAPGTAGTLLTPPLLAALGDALARLAARWPTGHEMVSTLVRRIQIDPHPDLNSKSVSELPGLMILGGHIHDPVGIAELLVHEAMHLLVYEMARLEAILPAPEEPRHSPYSRAETRPAYMVLHGAASFLAQAITTARLQDDRAVVAATLARERERLAAAESELRAHLAAHGAAPHPFVEAVFGEMAALRGARC